MAEENFDIITDFISPTTFDINAPKDIEVEQLDTLVINKENLIIWFGFVKEVYRSTVATTITVMHPMSLLDIPVRTKSPQDEQSKNCGWQVYNDIYTNFIASNNTVCSLPLIYYSGGGAYTNWSAYTPTYSGQVMSVMQTLITNEKENNLYLRWRFYKTGANTGKVAFSFKPVEDEVHLDIDGDFIINKTIEENHSFGSNIAYIWVMFEGAPSYYFACIKDGQIYYNDADVRRSILVPKVIAEDWTDRTWSYSTDIKPRLTEMLPSQADDLNIKVQVPYSNYFVRSQTYGERYVLHDNGKEYHCTLTGRRISGNIVELTFGTVRSNLTDKLNAERV